MEDRKAFELKGIIIAYNLFQTLLSFWGFSQGWKFYVTGDYRWQFPLILIFVSCN